MNGYKFLWCSINCIDCRGLSIQEKDLIKSKLTIPYNNFNSREDFENYFQQVISPFLLNGVEVVVGNHRLEIREIEFYFTCSNHHDPFTHCNVIQESSCNWYFHKVGNSYKAG